MVVRAGRRGQRCPALTQCVLANTCDTSRVLVMLVVLALTIWGVVNLARPLAPKQRVVLVLVFIAALVYLILKLVELGILGRVTT